MVALRLQSEGCEFDPRGGLVHDLFAASASLATFLESVEDAITRQGHRGPEQGQDASHKVRCKDTFD